MVKEDEDEEEVLCLCNLIVFDIVIQDKASYKDMKNQEPHYHVSYCQVNE